jgi:hypothetical protein
MLGLMLVTDKTSGERGQHAHNHGKRPGQGGLRRQPHLTNRKTCENPTRKSNSRKSARGDIEN